MAQYSELKDKDFQEILSQYGITSIQSYSVLSGGSENTNYLVVSNKGKFTLTISEQKTIKQAQDLASVLEYLADHEIPSSKIVRNLQNETVSDHKGKPVMLKQFIEGSIMTDLPPHLLELLGKTIAKIHNLKAPDFLPKTNWCTKERFAEIESYALNSKFHLWLKNIQTYVEGFISDELPRAFIHSDVFDNNVIVNEDKTDAIIMDFEEASYYYRLFDLGMMIIGTCSEGNTVNIDKGSHIIKGYQTVNKLSALELKALQAFTVYAAAGVAFWRHKQFNFTFPDPEMSDHYMVMKERADYVKGISSSSFLSHFTD